MSRHVGAEENESKASKASRPHHELRLFGYFHLISAIDLHTASRRLNRHALTTRCDKVWYSIACKFDALYDMEELHIQNSSDLPNKHPHIQI